MDTPPESLFPLKGDDNPPARPCSVSLAWPPPHRERFAASLITDKEGNPSATNNHHRQLMEQVLYEVKRVVVGQDRFLERVMVAMLAQGHLLVEGVPGLAKTLTVKTLAAPCRAVQAHPVHARPGARRPGGHAHVQPEDGRVQHHAGPRVHHLLLADEINRAPAKVQSALLEVMQERQVTIAGETHKVPEPFLVMATQNPIETEGTYALPEAQVDRFMMKVLVDYPTDEEEFVIAQRVTGPRMTCPVATTEQLAALQAECRRCMWTRRCCSTR
jgi:MoxR-like ATPase